MTIASGKNLTSAGGAANLDFSASSGTFASGTGAVTLSGNTSVVSGKTITIGGGTAIKVIELGTCQGAAAATTTCSAANTNTTGLTLANLVATDVITISGQGTSSANRVCNVDTIVPGSPGPGTFRIACSGANVAVLWNVLIVRR